jgi:hypothetical protein
MAKTRVMLLIAIVCLTTGFAQLAPDQTLTPRPPILPAALVRAMATDVPKPTGTPTPTSAALGIASARLTLDDLPSGYQEMSAADLQKMHMTESDLASSFGKASATAKPQNITGFISLNPTEIVVAFVRYPFSPLETASLEMALSPASVGSLATVLAGANGSQPSGLSDADKIGDKSIGATAVTSGATPMRIQMVLARRGNALEMVVVFYPVQQHQQPGAVELAQILDTRLAAALSGEANNMPSGSFGLAEADPPRAQGATSPTPASDRVATGKFQDHFDGASCNWDRGTYGGAEYNCVDGGYRFTMQQPHGLWLVSLNSPLKGTIPQDNLLMTAQVMQTQGSNGIAYGIIFRRQDGTHYYAFLVTNEGQYTLYRAEGSTNTPLVAWKKASAFKTGLNVPNTIGVDAYKNSISLYVNGERVETLTETAWTTGTVSIGAGARGGPESQPGTVSFDDISITSWK